jgi:hypothetical protein
MPHGLGTWRGSVAAAGVGLQFLRCSSAWTAHANRRFQFHKGTQLFIRVHNETLSVTMRVNDPDRLPRESASRERMRE